MKIQGNSILYDDHQINLIGKFDSKFAEEYIAEMANELSVNGSKEDHIAELENMNNDGSWVVQ